MAPGSIKKGGTSAKKQTQARKRAPKPADKARAKPKEGIREPSLCVRIALFIVGLILLPFSLSLIRTLLKTEELLGMAGPSGFSAQSGMFILGFLLFCILFVVLRMPMKPYLFAHELTHALFGLLHGAKISRLRVGEVNGSVKISSGGVIVLLAPYFFPLYMAGVMLAFGMLSIGFDLVGTFLGDVFAGVAGLAWGFHFCFTVNSLLQPQSDLEVYGFFFSLSMILFLNLVVLCMAHVALTPVTFNEMTGIALYLTKDSLAWLWNAFSETAWPPA